MSATTPQPIRGLVWLVRRVSSRDAANAAIGDVLDELADRTRSARTPRWPRLWVNAQTIKVASAFALSMTPRLSRSGAHMVRDAVRSLWRSPAYSTLVIALLALGIAAAAITYSVVDAVVLRPLALEQGDRLVLVATSDATRKTRMSLDQFRAVHDEVAGFDSVARTSIESGAIVTIGGATDEIEVLRSTSDLFHVLRFVPAIGRVWTAEDEARGDTDVAVLGYRYWTEHFHGDPGVLGQTIVAGRGTYRVIGVLAANTDVPGLSYSGCALWLPMKPTWELFGITARTRPGVSPAEIAMQVQNAIASPNWRPAVTPLLDNYVGRVRGWMLLALGAAGLVILIACVNAANIMLTRSFRRAHELAIRSSLGASRRQIAMSVMTEGIALSVAASACALLVAVWGVNAARLAVTTHLMGTFRAATIALNGRVLGAAIGAALVTGVLSSLVPAWQASRASVVGVLKDAGPTVTGGGRSWRSGLLIVEIACVTVLLVVSWLFVTSLIRVVNIDLGVDRSHLLAVSPRLNFNGTVDDVQRRLESVPGVTSVAVTAGGASLPLVGRAFGGAWITTSVQKVNASGELPALTVLMYRVTSNYFDVAGIRFRRGAMWAAESAAGASSVVLDERAAAQLFGGEDPLGRQIRATEPAGVFTVVGIVPYVYARGAEDPVEPQVYFALSPKATRTFAGLFVRTTAPAEEMVSVLTDALAPFAPDGKTPYIHAADEAERRITATRRFNGGLMSAFGCIAVLIGAAGIYGVIAAVVTQQTREIGVRVALGATPGVIHRGVLTLTGTHVVSGLAVGLPLAWWISRGFSAYLFQVTPADPFVYAGVATLVGAVGFAAALIPARRAARTDPMITLRA